MAYKEIGPQLDAVPSGRDTAARAWRVDGIAKVKLDAFGRKLGSQRLANLIRIHIIEEQRLSMNEMHDSRRVEIYDLSSEFCPRQRPSK